MEIQNEDITDTTAAHLLKASAAVALFQGANSVLGSGRATAVKGTSKSVQSKNTVDYTFCIDTETLSKSLEIDQSASVGIGLFGASEKVKIVEETKQTTWCINLLIHAVNITGTDIASDWSLLTDKSAPKTNDEKRDFCRYYGDSFVSSITSGAEYIGIFTFYLQSEEEKKSTATELAASGLTSFVSFGADLQTKLSNFMSKTKVRVGLKQTIIGVRGVSQPASSEMIDFALKFSSLEVKTPAVLSVGFTGYEHVPGFGDFMPVPRNREYFIGDGIDSGIRDAYAQVKTLNHQLDWLLGLYAVYGGFKDAKVVEVKALAKADQQAIEAQVKGFSQDPLGSFTKPPLPSLTYGMPVLQHTDNSTLVYGGKGGDSFDDVEDVSAFIGKAKRIKKLQLYSGSYVYGLTTTYIGMGADFLETESVCARGRQNGEAEDPLLLLENEAVVKVGGSHGDYVELLEFTTSEKRTTKGGGGSGSNIDWTVPEGAVLLGFRGRDGHYIDRIQMIYTTLKPAAWR